MQTCAKEGVARMVVQVVQVSQFSWDINIEDENNGNIELEIGDVQQPHGIVQPVNDNVVINRQWVDIDERNVVPNRTRGVRIDTQNLVPPKYRGGDV